MFLKTNPYKVIAVRTSKPAPADVDAEGDATPEELEQLTATPETFERQVSSHATREEAEAALAAKLQLTADEAKNGFVREGHAVVQRINGIEIHRIEYAVRGPAEG